MDGMLESQNSLYLELVINCRITLPFLTIILKYISIRPITLAY